MNLDNIALIIAGKNNIAANALEFVLQKGLVRAEQVAVLPALSDPNESKEQKSLKQSAKNLGVKIISQKEAQSAQNALFMSLEYDLLINPCDFATKRLFNIHFSLLPRYRGAFTSVFPILYGEKKSGVSLHRINSGCDSGEIVAQRSFKIPLQATSCDLYALYNENAFLLFKEQIAALLSDIGDDKIRSKPQSAVNASYFWRQQIDLGSFCVDLRRSSYQIHNQIRALDFPKYQRAKIAIFGDLFEIGGSFLHKNFLIESKIKKIDSIKDKIQIDSITEQNKNVLKYLNLANKSHNIKVYEIATNKSGANIALCGLDGYKITAQIKAIKQEQKEQILNKIASVYSNIIATARERERERERESKTARRGFL